MSFARRYAAGALVPFLFTATANAQAPQVEKNVSMKMALMIMEGVLEQCAKDGYKVSVVVVDKAGNVAASVRGDGTNPHTMEFGRLKAYTARTRGQTSLEFKNLTDKPETAYAKKTALMNYWSMQNQSGAWHFLTGDEPQIKQVTSAAGFFYMWDEKTQQYAHLSGLLVLTPDGRLSRYFYGIEYSPKELRLALFESGQGHIGSIVDELLLYCYHYDPANGRYGAVVMNLVRLGGVLTVLAIAGFILLMRRQERRQMEGHA